MPEGFDASLKVGEEVKVRKGWVVRSMTMMYAGMPGPDVFSVAVTWKEGNQAATANLYFPIDQRGFDIAEGHVSVTHVDEKSIRFRFEKL